MKIIESSCNVSEKKTDMMDLTHYEGDIFEIRKKDSILNLDNPTELYWLFYLIKNKIKKIPYFGYGWPEDWK